MGFAPSRGNKIFLPVSLGQKAKMANCSFNKVRLGPVHRKAYAPNPPKTAIKFVFLAAVFKNLGLYRFKMV